MELYFKISCDVLTDTLKGSTCTCMQLLWDLCTCTIYCFCYHSLLWHVLYILVNIDQNKKK